MTLARATPVVHLELHTGDLQRAEAFYTELCGWRTERVNAGLRSYLALAFGRGFGGGIVECPTERSPWLPYVQVGEIAEVIERARQLGASVLLEPHEGPAGWRRVLATYVGGEIAFWQAER